MVLITPAPRLSWPARAPRHRLRCGSPGQRPGADRALDQDPEGGHQPGALAGDGGCENPGPALGEEAFQPSGVLVPPDGADPGQGDVPAVWLHADGAGGEGDPVAVATLLREPREPGPLPGARARARRSPDSGSGPPSACGPPSCGRTGGHRTAAAHTPPAQGSGRPAARPAQGPAWPCARAVCFRLHLADIFKTRRALTGGCAGWEF
jgi:hypothetical protein